MVWDAITALSSAFTGIVIVISAFFGLDQLRQMRAQRRDSAAVELARSLQDVQVMRALSLIFTLAPDTPAAEFHARGREYEDAALLVALRFEMLGVLVHRRVISFDVIEDLAGGAVLGFWQRTRNYIFEQRAAHDYAIFMEWFQWLAERFEERNRLSLAPAHLRHRNWHPSERRLGV